MSMSDSDLLRLRSNDNIFAKIMNYNYLVNHIVKEHI